MAAALIVDDSPTETLIFRNALRKAGFRLETAVNGEEGVRTAQRVHPELILMDLIMPSLMASRPCVPCNAIPLCRAFQSSL